MGMRAHEAMRQARGIRRGDAGFTLVELMIVVAIIAILLVIAGWNFAGWIGRHKVEAFTRDLQAALTDTRMSAVQSSSTHCFILNTAAAQANLFATYLVNRDTGNDLICNGVVNNPDGTKDPIVSGFPKNLVPGTTNPASPYRVNNLQFIVNTAAGKPEVDFSPRGMLIDSTGTMVTRTILKVNYPGECWFTGECANAATDRKVYADIDCVVLTSTEINVGLGRIDPATNKWDGINCDVK